MSEAETPAATPAAKSTAVPPAAVPAVTPPAPTVEVPVGSRLYEAMFLVDANAARENFTKVLTGIRETIEKSGGTWVNGDKYEERRLAYTVKKRKRGLYVLAHFICPTQAMLRVERNLQISDLIMRALVTVDLDGLGLTPPARGLDDDDDGPGGERRFFGGDRGGGGRRRFGGDREERGDRGERGGGGGRGGRGERPPRS